MSYQDEEIRYYCNLLELAHYQSHNRSMDTSENYYLLQLLRIQGIFLRMHNHFFLSINPYFKFILNPLFSIPRLSHAYE